MRIELLIVAVVPLLALAALVVGTIALFRVRELKKQMGKLAEHIAKDREELMTEQVKQPMPRRTPPDVTRRQEVGTKI